MAVKPGAAAPEAAAMPALYVNRFEITGIKGGLVRVSFGETLGTVPTIFRTAVILSDENARALALSLINGLGTASSKPS